MITVGLTGGIGSGKSTVAKVFSMLGVPVFDSDKAAKSCYSDPKVKESVLVHFGQRAFTKGQVDFKKLAQIVFADAKELKWLNHEIHPLVKNKFERWQMQQHSPYLIKEAAILFESGAYLSCEKIITVVCAEETKIKRIIKRDRVSEKKVIERMNQQWSDDKKIKLSQFIIDNNQLILPQILKIHQSLTT